MPPQAPNVPRYAMTLGNKGAYQTTHELDTGTVHDVDDEL